MKTRQDHYPTEDFLVQEFCSALASNETPWGKVNLIREFNYLRGRTDVVVVDRNNNVLAFELKLRKWVHAMQQAYRNTCFAHHSYVVLPEPTAKLAHRYFREFERRSIGLCSIKDGSVVILVPAVHQKPIQPWLSNFAASKSGNGTSNESTG
jgi:hypothetical protein